MTDTVRAGLIPAEIITATEGTKRGYLKQNSASEIGEMFAKIAEQVGTELGETAVSRAIAKAIRKRASE